MIFFGNVDLLASHPYYVANVQVVAENKTFNELKLSELLNSIRSDQLKFQVYWVRINTNVYQKIRPYVPGQLFLPPSGSPPGFTMSPSLYDFRIFIQNPTKLYYLSNTNDPKILDELVKLLDQPSRGWAANITIAKMLGLTGLDRRTFVYETTPQKWWETEGKTGKAKREWATYLQKVKPTLKWSPLGGYYEHRAPDGHDVY
jgi:hypothetical protein